MERQVDGQEPVGSLNQFNSAEGPGKIAFFLVEIYFYILLKTLAHDQTVLIGSL